MADNKKNKAAGSKSRKKMTVEEQPPKGLTKTKSGNPARSEAAKSVPRALLPGNAAFPLRYAFAVFCGILLLIFISVFFSDEGLILQWVVSVFSGLFGRYVYYISIPVLIYLIWIQLSSRGHRVRGRSFCMMGFSLIFGCLSHMVLSPELTEEGIHRISELYRTGIPGSSGGVICGLVAEVLTAGFGPIFTYVSLIILAAVCLMVGVQLNIPGILMACFNTVRSLFQNIRDRMTPDDDMDDYEEYEVDEENTPGPWNRLWDRIASKNTDQTEPVDVMDSAALRPGKPAQKILTKTEVPIVPSFVDVYDEPDPGFPEDVPPPPIPADILPDDPELDAGVAAQPGAAAQNKVTAQEAAQQAAQVEQEIAASQAVPKPEYCFPPIDLLQRPRGRAADGTAEMKENTQRLNETLASFKIDAHISNVTRGPSVTRYEVELEKGVRLNKLTTCADDIALSLGASGVRIAPVPGKISVVGIEVPNHAVTNVSLRDVIDSPEFQKARSRSSIAVGKDIGGSCIVGNIAKFPHMLIAGTTGSGKSVCMNSIIISLLYKASPDDVKLIMVDPKMVELGIYNGIPHLLIPVVTDPKKAAGSLQWAVTEMMRRYRSMSDAGVRDLESYNSMIEGGEVEGVKLPQVVVIIDELADLMLVAAKEVEESICRIAQMGRAAGIHLIIATQRPSADVITGLMKANIPSRIAFSVASAMESRIILDTVGAEKLVGKGDMLYSPIGSGKPQRVQGCFVTDAEVEAVAGYVKEHFASTYDQAVMDDIERKAEQTGTKGGSPATASDPDPSAEELAHDEMLPDAVEVILETKQASVSLLQRRLKLGYARAARIVDEMEEMGIVGPFVGSKPRQILVTKEQWDQMKQGQTIVKEPDEPVPEEITDLPF